MEAGKILSELPKMKQRRIAFHQMLFESKQETKINEETETNSLIILPALAQSVTQIPEKEIASTAKDGGKLDHTRSGLRFWPLPPQSYAEVSPVPMAMALLNAQLCSSRKASSTVEY